MPADWSDYAPDAEVVDLCRDLIRIDTSNYGPDPGPGEREAAEYVAGRLDDVGIASELYESEPGRTSLVAHWEPEGVDRSLSPLLIHGHLDVVPANAEDWSQPPFAGEIVDGCLWGRGAVDMKDFDAMLLSVVRARARAGAAPRRPLRLVFTADEEAGGEKGALWMVREHPELLEGCRGGDRRGRRLLADRGRRSSALPDPDRGEGDRLAEAHRRRPGRARVLPPAPTTRSPNLRPPSPGSGNYEWPHRITDAQRAFLEAVSEALDIEFDPDRAEETLAKLGSIARMVGATMSNTANPTMLQAGYKHNVIPASATAAIDGRIVPGGEDEFFATLTDLLGDKVRYEVLAHHPSVETEFSGALVDAMQTSLVAEDPGARTVPYLMSGGTDAKAWSRLGIRCFGFAPLRLPPDLDFVSLFHGRDERVPTESLEFGARVLDRFLDLA